MIESEYMKEARLSDAELDKLWGSLNGDHPVGYRRFARMVEAALLSHIAKGEQARAVGGDARERELAPLIELGAWLNAVDAKPPQRMIAALREYIRAQLLAAAPLAVEGDGEKLE